MVHSRWYPSPPLQRARFGALLGSAQRVDLDFTAEGVAPERLEAFFEEAMAVSKKREPIFESGNKCVSTCTPLRRMRPSTTRGRRPWGHIYTRACFAECRRTPPSSSPQVRCLRRLPRAQRPTPHGGGHRPRLQVRRARHRGPGPRVALSRTGAFGQVLSWRGSAAACARLDRTTSTTNTACSTTKVPQLGGSARME